jgi:hypothetical protein
VDKSEPNCGAFRAAAVALAFGLAAVPLLAGCGSASAHTPAAASSAVSASCADVGAALSDGPDPDADPVGYAEAQIKPLRAIKTADPVLRTAISDLASAYAGVYSSHGKSTAAAKAAATASRKVNAICPGAAS